MEKKRILIVDDKESVGGVMVAYAHAGMYSTLYCNSGKDALSMLDVFNPDLVITDFQMPAMDGLELTEKIKKEKPNLPIIISTGRPDLIPANNPADMVMGKPFFITEFLEKIKKLI